MPLEGAYGWVEDEWPYIPTWVIPVSVGRSAE